ncbi:HNH endonuclease [Sulfurimonas sp.]|uniref:HNH endonuclease n=1 Tax=Sulfurimonas sp. TaxID=2022749 RepID=UPI0025F49075|nr:HNH endonuclease [Sulfurimonas sp.]
MNYWQFKFSKWNGWKKLEVGEIIEWQSPKNRNKKPNDIAIDDVVFLFRGGSGVSKDSKGIYFITEVKDIDFTSNPPVKLKVIKNLREDFFIAENYGFSNFVNQINNMRQNPHATYYKFLKSEKPERLYDIIINSTSMIDDLSEINNSEQLSETEKKNLVNCRIGQGDFRKSLISHWSGCSITKHKQIDILIASHIKPWKDSTNSERLDKYNGFLLVPNLDKLFDKGYISFDDEGKIMISTELSNFEKLSVNKKMKVDIKNAHKKYLQFHRAHIFKSNI